MHSPTLTLSCYRVVVPLRCCRVVVLLCSGKRTSTACGGIQSHGFEFSRADPQFRSKPQDCSRASARDLPEVLPRWRPALADAAKNSRGGTHSLPQALHLSFAAACAIAFQSTQAAESCLEEAVLSPPSVPDACLSVQRHAAAHPSRSAAKPSGGQRCRDGGIEGVVSVDVAGEGRCMVRGQRDAQAARGRDATRRTEACSAGRRTCVMDVMEQTKKNQTPRNLFSLPSWIGLWLARPAKSRNARAILLHAGPVSQSCVAARDRPNHLSLPAPQNPSPICAFNLVFPLQPSMSHRQNLAWLHAEHPAIRTCGITPSALVMHALGRSNGSKQLVCRAVLSTGNTPSSCSTRWAMRPSGSQDMGGI